MYDTKIPIQSKNQLSKYHVFGLSKSHLLEKFVCFIMKNGEKDKAYKILYKTLNIIMLTVLQAHKLRTMYSKLTATSIVLQAINNVKPSLEVRKVRKSGRTILIPRIVPTTRQEVLAIRWIIESARQNKRKSRLSFSECLALELFYAFQKKGQARQKRDELHKIAQANRAFLRFRWW
uniref:Ribosomal protein S7 n=1 Tax=Ostreobium quekettii TaxID=121088 RepID=A0A650BY76_9CHLO|nr:ribosomal protein S7 [Ostreobium quekettii]QGQ62020.1 ribosomal protein S7 [Ostreobium quekettii]